MVSGSWACTSITTPKSVGRFPLTSRHESPASSDRMTSQCFCMNSTLGRDRCSAMRWTQCPISALGSGMYCECRPRLIGFQVVPPSSERNAPAAEMATYIRRGSLGSSRTVWRHIPPAPGCHLGPVPWPRSPANSCHVLPPSLVRNNPASSTPARSEEHTSELQSLAYLVCRLLLEKKKKRRASKNAKSKVRL